jgi:hypothetical protein
MHKPAAKRWTLGCRSPTLYFFAMKNTDEILDSAGETFEYARQYLKQQGDYIRLEAAERVSKTASAMVTALVLGALSLLVLIMLSLAAAFWLGNAMGSYAEAFVVIAVFYCLFGGILYIFRRQLVTNPTLKLMLNAFFDRENEASGK